MNRKKLFAFSYMSLFAFAVNAFYIFNGDCSETSSDEVLNNDIPPNSAILHANVEKTYQTVKTFGVSGAWWSTGIGNRENIDEILSLLFTNEGIVLNGYRHNIGGGRAEGPLADDARGPDLWRAVPCPLQSDGYIDLNADANGFKVLQKVNALGTVDGITIFMTSPPASMTVSGKTYHPDGKPNLRPECYEEYAAFVADVTKACLDAGISVKYVSPVNEPQWGWEKGWQEGCYFSPEEILRLSRLVVAELNKYGLPGKLSLNESGTLNSKEYVYDFYKALMADPDIAPYIDHFAAHSYFSSDTVKCYLRKHMDATAETLHKMPLPLHQTEWAAWSPKGELSSITRLLWTAKVIHEDLTLLNVDTWEYFAAVGRGHDALIVVNDNNNDYELTSQFWAMGNYSRFIKGYTRVKVEAENLPKGVLASAYINKDAGQMVFVVINEDESVQTVTFSGMPKDGKGEVYETSAERTCKTVRGVMRTENGYVLPAQSVSTFVFRSPEINN